MIKILLLIPLALLVGCRKYSSFSEAQAGCGEWSWSKAMRVDVISVYLNDEPTRQVIGYSVDNKVMKRFLD